MIRRLTGCVFSAWCFPALYCVVVYFFKVLHSCILRSNPTSPASKADKAETAAIRLTHLANPRAPKRAHARGCLNGRGHYGPMAEVTAKVELILIFTTPHIARRPILGAGPEPAREDFMGGKWSLRV